MRSPINEANDHILKSQIAKIVPAPTRDEPLRTSAWEA